MSRKFDPEYVKANLVPDPPPGLLEAAMAEYPVDLGGNLMVFSRVSHAPDDEDGGPQWTEDPAPRKWAARCCCTKCGADWLSGWMDGRHGGPGVYLAEGPDGTLYPGIPNAPDAESDGCAEWEGVREARDGDEDPVACPLCGAELYPASAGELRGGQTFRLMIAVLSRAGDHTAVMYWTAERTLGIRHGVARASASVSPFAAAVVDDGGSVRVFRWMRGGWVFPKDGADPEDLRYRSCEAVNHTKIGCAVLPAFLSRPAKGDTGEKTGIYEYMAAGGCCPAKYLRFRRVAPTVENLLKSGWGRAVVTAIAAEYDRHLGGTGHRIYNEEIQLIADYAHAKPSAMLTMTRTEARMGKEWNWDAETLMLWQGLCVGPEPVLLGPGDAAVFHRMVREYGIDNIRRWGNPDDGGIPEYTLPEAEKYLRRQMRLCGLHPPEAFTMLLDYRVMLNQTAEGPEDFPTETLWPNRLRTAHDALAARFKDGGSYDFGPVLRRWGKLEWTDGQYCVRLPRKLADLTEEGNRLHHCVGSYGKQHVSGKLILFVRRYRRPERSYYTLNEDVSGFAPKRIQLHGYGNEFAHGRRLTIPRTVLDFVTRWEKEILAPEFARQRRHAG